MRRYLISDLHLGDGSGADNFGPPNGKADHELIGFCNMLPASDKIILVGDVFELWQCSIDDILRAHSDAIECLMAHTEVYVAGNHDSDLLGLNVYSVEVIPKFVDKSLLVIHGHQFDELVQHWGWLAQAGSWSFGMLERIFRSPKNRRGWHQRSRAYLSRTGRHGCNESYIKAIAAAYENETWCKTVVFGHTHSYMPLTQGAIYQTKNPPNRCLQLARLVIANAGSWVDGKRDVLEIA